MTGTFDWPWDDGADVVIAGAGGAGLMAALTASERGASVLVLEKAANIGGKTAMAIGSFTASETEMQREAGIADSHDDHLADMTALAETIGIKLDPERARLRIAEDSATLARLIELGIRFSGPHPEGPHRVPRMHVILPRAQVLVETLAAACRDRGVRFMTGCGATDLVVGAGGRVTGLIAETGAGPIRLKAWAVVLCSGDYSANRDLLRHLAPKATLSEPIRPTHTGDAHAMAARVGAMATRMERLRTPNIRMVTWPHLEPDAKLYELGVVLVDRTGRAVSPSHDGLDAPEEDLFLIIDSGVAKSLASAEDDVGPGRDGWKRTGRPFVGTAPDVAYAYLEDCVGRDWYTEAASIEEVARRIGCPTDALADLGEPPFHVMGPARRYLMGVGGALATGTDMSVLDESGSAIPGLYAAGEASAWMAYAGGHGYGISWATTSGRLAGAAAANA
jgi:fumarate reductase flavoprotein subunit